MATIAKSSMLSQDVILQFVCHTFNYMDHIKAMCGQAPLQVSPKCKYPKPAVCYSTDIPHLRWKLLQNLSSSCRERTPETCVTCTRTLVRVSSGEKETAEGAKFP